MKIFTPLALICTFTFVIISNHTAFSQMPTHPNIIMIYIDDLNDYTNYQKGHPQVETPNINRLVESGVAFTNAYCSSPGCGPSRTSMLSGKDCLYTQVYNNNDFHGSFRSNFNEAKNNEIVFTLPEVLKNSGEYYTYSIGKVFHSESGNDYDKSPLPMCEKTKSWNRMTSLIETEEFTAISESYLQYEDYDWGMIPDSLEHHLQDVQITDTAVQFINDVGIGNADICDKPFFLAFGIHKPHTPRLIPEKYFLPYYVNALDDKIAYNFSTMDSGYNGVVMPPQPETMWGDFYALPENGIAQIMATTGDQEMFFNGYLNSLPALPVLDGSVSAEENYEMLLENERAKYVMGYLAATKFLDAQIGRLLDTLQQYPEIYNNTIIVLVSDHGYSLGEKRHYTKWALWDTDIRVPLIFSGPGVIENGSVDATVSLIDIMPTICDIAGVPLPNFPDGSTYIDGTSFKNLIINPNAYFNKPAISAYRRNSGNGSCFPHYSVEHDGYHYIRYHNNNDAGEVTPCDETNTNYDEELYYVGVNREVDPNEWNNLASDPNNAPIIEYLSSFLPGNPNYLKQSMKVEINLQGGLPCYAPHSGKLKMKAKLYSTTGAPLSSALMANYNFIWTNSATALIKNSTKFTFNMSSIPSDYYSSQSSITFYLKITDKITGDVMAFDTYKVFINPDNIPVLDFTPDLNGQTLAINDVSVSGDYTTIEWDLGDGTTTDLYNPLTHIYSGQGTFPILQTVNYGNSCTLQKQKTVYIKYITDVFCAGGYYLLPDGSIATTPGKYTTNLTSVSGTDSVVIFKLNYASGCDELLRYSIANDESEIHHENISKSIFNVYPNPVNNTLNVKRTSANQQADIQLYTMGGQLLNTFQMQPEEYLIQIPMSNYASSMYLLKIIEQSDWNVFTIIKNQ